MPSKPGRPCKTPGCGQIVGAGDGPYCADHVGAGTSIDDRPSSSRRGYDRRWRALRKRVLAEEPICRDPYKRHPGRLAPTTDIDHIIPRSCGGEDERKNLQGLCHSCHSYKTLVIERNVQGSGGQISTT